MALELVAVDGCTLDHYSGDVTGGTFAILPASVPSLFLGVNGQGAYRTPLSFVLTGGTKGGSSNMTGTGAIVASAIYVKDDMVLVIRETDRTSTIVNYSGTDGVGSPVTGSGHVEVSAAGQLSMKAE